MGYFFQISFVQWLFCFAQNLLTLVTILIYKNFFGPLGYRPCHGPRLSFIPVLKAITHRESWVQRHRYGFESRTARVNLKEDMDMDEETSERIRTGCTTATKEREDQRKSWYTSTCSEYVQKECVGIWRGRSAERGSREWRTKYSSRRSRRIWDYLFKRQRSCSQAQLQEAYHSFLPCSSQF